jgi:hypothetical protein
MIIINFKASDKDTPDFIPKIDSFIYAMRLADSIRVTIDKSQGEYAKWIKDFIEVAVINLSSPSGDVPLLPYKSFTSGL